MPKPIFPKSLLPVLLGALILSGCGEAEDSAPEMPDDDIHAGIEIPDDDVHAGVELPEDDAHASVAPAPTAVQAAVQRGAERAYSLGFSNAQAATADELQQLRETTVPEADSVYPAACTGALSAINTSPVQLSEDAARVDFGSESYLGTGTVESAVLGETAATTWLDDYTKAVSQFTNECAEVEMVLGGETFYFEASSPAVEADMALNWQRTPKLAASSQESELGTIHSQVLVTRDGDTINLVSFVGDEPSTSQEFTQIGEQILASMQAED